MFQVLIAAYESHTNLRGNKYYFIYFMYQETKILLDSMMNKLSASHLSSPVPELLATT